MYILHYFCFNHYLFDKYFTWNRNKSGNGTQHLNFFPLPADDKINFVDRNFLIRVLFYLSSFKKSFSSSFYFYLYCFLFCFLFCSFFFFAGLQNQFPFQSNLLSLHRLSFLLAHWQPVGKKTSARQPKNKIVNECEIWHAADEFNARFHSDLLRGERKSNQINAERWILLLFIYN